MAHFVLEYSDNIEPAVLAVQSLFGKLHAAARDSGIFPYKGVRSRAYACHDYRMADGNPRHMFVHLSVLIGPGRTMEEKEDVARQFFTILREHFARCFEERGVAMSFEMRELEPVLKYNANNIQDHLKDDA
jgi:5-carboxymethyl-2-hydroxymuconate isomerase